MGHELHPYPAWFMLTALTSVVRDDREGWCHSTPSLLWQGPHQGSLRTATYRLPGIQDHDFKESYRVQGSERSRHFPCMTPYLPPILLCHSSSFHWVYHAQLEGNIFQAGLELHVAIWPTSGHRDVEVSERLSFCHSGLSRGTEWTE